MPEVSDPQGDLGVLGRRCVAVRRMYHRFHGEAFRTAGPLELAWSEHGHTTIDAAADWTLTISSQAWCDPFAAASDTEREALAREVGRWEPEAPAAGDPLAQIIGSDVTAAEPIFNEVGELSGLQIWFGPVELVARVVGGEIALEASRSR